MKMRAIKIPLAALLVLLTVFLYSCEAVPAAAYKFGASGDQVKEIQQRLKDWGYYKGKVDGYYGKDTENAVIAFQKKHGITIDGIVGSKTAEKLGVSISGAGGSSSGASSNSSDVYLLAQLVYAEARGEPYKGQVAVAAVVLNRVESSKFPGSIAKVIYQSGAFSVVDDGQINLAPDQTALSAARDAMNGWDPSGGALFYYNPNTATSGWIWSRPVIVVIGNHKFCS
jgi:N-acetylmuramoyl-L-alanine amidase